MPKEDNKAVARRVLEAFNTGNTGIIDEVFEESFHSASKPFPGVAATRDGLKDEIRKLREAFPDAQFTETGISEQGNTVTLNWSMTGTHKAPILGVEPSGERVTQTGQEVLEFRGGRISGRKGREEHEEFHQKLQANAARKHDGGGGAAHGQGH